MIEYFEMVYKSFCKNMEEFFYWLELFWRSILYSVVHLTLPLWVIPYAIYRKRKKK
jgi:hypothetical protein